MFPVMSCDCSVGRLSLHGLAVRGDEHAGHETQGAVALGHDVRLDVAVVVLARPHEAAVGLERLGDHVVNQTVLVPDAGLLVLVFKLPERWKRS